MFAIALTSRKGCSVGMMGMHLSADFAIAALGQMIDRQGKAVAPVVFAMEWKLFGMVGSLAAETGCFDTAAVFVLGQVVRTAVDILSATLEDLENYVPNFAEVVTAVRVALVAQVEPGKDSMNSK